MWNSEQIAVISLYNINWLVCITETECVYCAVRTGSLYIIIRSAHTAVFICSVWISEQTAIISLYSINWLVCITETECSLRGTDWILKHDSSDTVQPTGHYMYRTVVTICTAQWSLYVQHSGHDMYRTAVTICTTSLTFTILRSTHTAVFMCFVWISEQTAIISLYSINRLVFRRVRETAKSEY